MIHNPTHSGMRRCPRSLSRGGPKPQQHAKRGDTTRYCECRDKGKCLLRPAPAPSSDQCIEVGSVGHRRDVNSKEECGKKADSVPHTSAFPASETCICNNTQQVIYDTTPLGNSAFAQGRTSCACSILQAQVLKHSSSHDPEVRLQFESPWPKLDSEAPASHHMWHAPDSSWPGLSSVCESDEGMEGYGTAFADYIHAVCCLCCVVPWLSSA